MLPTALLGMVRLTARIAPLSTPSSIGTLSGGARSELGGLLLHELLHGTRQLGIVLLAKGAVAFAVD